MNLSIQRLEGPFGARVTGIDLREPLAAEHREAIEDALARHRVLSFPGQPLDDAQQIRYAGSFGPLFKAMRTHAQRRLENPYFQDVSNLNAQGEIARNGERKYSDANLLWHTDLCYLPRPARTTILNARQLPKEPPPTEFADTVAAWKALPASEQRLLEGLQVRFSIVRSRARVGYSDFSEQERELFQPATHPLVRMHPRTGHKALYVSSHAFEIVGRGEAASEQLLQELIGHATQASFVYAYPWQLGDLIMWDDGSTLHRAVPFAAKESEVRELRWNAVLEEQA